MPKVLMPFGDATEALDTFYPYFRLPEDGFEVVVAGPEARLYHSVFTRFRPIPMCPGTSPKSGRAITFERPSRFVTLSPTTMPVCSSRPACAPEYLRYDQDLLRITRAIYQAGKPIACVCHGVEILTAADIIRGKTVTTVAKCAVDAQQGGATYVDRPVVVCGTIVTARTWHDNTPLLREFLAMLKAAANP